MKYYIWLNIASSANHYWNQTAQNWTTDAYSATLFDSREAAEAEAKYAAEYGSGEVYVRQKTKRLPRKG